LAQDEPRAGDDQALDARPEGSTDVGEEAPGADPKVGEVEQPRGGRSGSIQEVIQVEGARTAGLKEVPISVTSFGASDIQNLRIQNVADLSAYTPNLEINTSFAASNPTLFIRGVGLKDYNSNSTGAVSIWQDGIMMNSPAAQLFSLYDIESIEVLRGPVGGVGGRNASAGMIRMNSFKPNGEWTSDGSFSAGNLNLLEFEGALGFPIFPDLLNNMVSARVSVATQFRDGYTNNVCSKWAPEEYGYLESSEPRTNEFYALLDPHDRGLPLLPPTRQFPNGKPDPESYVFRNLDAVEAYNAFPGQAAINLINADGETVGLQGSFFRISPDGACLLDNAGRVVTDRNVADNLARGRVPPGPAGTFLTQQNILGIDHFQGLQDTYNNVEYYATRAQLLFEPLESLSFLANFHWGANRGDAYHQQPIGARPRPAPTNQGVVIEPPGFFQSANSSGFTEINEPFPPFETQVEAPGVALNVQGEGQGFRGADIFSGFYSTDGKENLDLMGAMLDTTYEGEWGRVVYLGGWEFNSRDIIDEGGACPCTDLEQIIDDQTWQFSNDVRVTGEVYRFDWTFGLFQLHENLESNNVFPSSIKFEIDQAYGQVTNAFNVGTDLHYDFFEDGAYRWLYQISLDGGFRYNWEHKKFNLAAAFRKTQQDVEKITIPAETVKELWQAPTGEATLSFQPIENARIYGKYTRGFKAGHFNAGLTIQNNDEVKQSLNPVAPESIDAVEVGIKSSWIDDRLELNAAFFRYWYKDLQVFDIVNEFGAIPTQQLLNSDADVMGAELELTVRPLDGLLLQVGMGWLDTAFREFTVVKQAVAPSGIGGNPGQVAEFNYEGHPLIAAPQWSLSGYTEYELPLYRWGSLVPSFDFSYKSRTYLDPTMELAISQAAYWVFGARLAYRTPGGRIEVAGWVTNFMDERYLIDAFDFTRQFGQINQVWSEPRTFGFTISYAF